jgi:hypothetical protein
MNATSEQLLDVKKVTETGKTSFSTVGQSDLIVDTIHQVETLTKENAFAEAHTLVDAGVFSNFKLGGILCKIYGQEDWLGGQSFKTVLEQEFPQIKYRKANYLMNIYTNLVESEVVWSQVGHLGWTKLKELAPILTKDNVDAWVKKAESMTVLQLIEAIKNALAVPNSDNPLDDESTKTLTTITFKVYEDQKQTIRDALDKAKIEGGSEFDNVAIENICMNYLSGATIVPVKEGSGEIPFEKSLHQLITEKGYLETLMLVSTMYPDVNIDFSES